MVFTRTAETAVLLDPQSGEYFSLSDVGARIWELCDGDHTDDAIAEQLATEYDAPAETIRADALGLLAELESEGLLANG